VKVVIVTLLVISGFIIFASPIDAFALPQMRIIADGAPSLTIADNAPGDIDPQDGSIVFSGTIGDFVVDVNIGITKPIFGTETQPSVSFSVNVFRGPIPGTSDIIVEFSDTDFVNSVPLVMSGDVSSNVSPSGQIEVFRDNGNTLFTKTNLEFDTGIISGIFLGPESFTMNTSGDYSLTFVASMTVDSSSPAFIDVDVITVDKILAGELLPTSQVSLLLGGLQTYSIWYLPIILSGVGLTIYKFRKNLN